MSEEIHPEHIGLHPADRSITSIIRQKGARRHWPVPFNRRKDKEGGLVLPGGWGAPTNTSLHGIGNQFRGGHSPEVSTEVVSPTAALSSDQNDLSKPLNLTYSLVKELPRLTPRPKRLCRSDHFVSTKPPAERG